MNESHDQSYLDRKYFIDQYKYNCPFCNRKSVTYSVRTKFNFNWSNERLVYGYLVKCGGDTCLQTSLHFSDYNIEIYNNRYSSIEIHDETISLSNKELNELFFYHQPTTFFTLDNRINKKIRILISEAEGCAKMNYFVGASGCLRKTIYELLEIEDVPRVDDKGGQIDYGDRVKLLKNKYTVVPPEYFDALSNIQGMTSEQLHEGDWKPWNQYEFRFLVETTKEVLTEIYVRPKEKSSVLQKILGLRPQKVKVKDEATVIKETEQ